MLTIIADIPILLSRLVKIPASMRIKMMTGIAAIVVQNSASVFFTTMTTN